MKKIVILLLLTISTSLTLYAQKSNYEESKMVLSSGDKLAIVMVHFGTTVDDTRAKTIDAINNKVRSLYTNADIYEAYTSRIVINRLRVKGINKQTPTEVLEELIKNGYTHVVVQSTHVIDGVEMESLRIEVRYVKNKFKDIRIGKPLLYTPSDYSNVIDAFTHKIPTTTDAVVLVGHGTYSPITASYAMMDYMLKDKGLDNWHIGTIEGYPTFDNILVKLANSGAKHILLAPMMFVSGEHAKNDIKGDWKDELEKQGYKVSLFMEGMGENSKIHDIIIQHIEYALNNRHLDIMEKKRGYAAE